METRRHQVLPVASRGAKGFDVFVRLGRMRKGKQTEADNDSLDWADRFIAQVVAEDLLSTVGSVGSLAA